MNETIWGLPYFYFLIGHRGVGKSTFLKQLSSCYPSLPCYDLDQEIERISGRTISELFVQEGEGVFRTLERQVLQHLLTKVPVGSVIALGAGFELDAFPFPTNSLFHWLRRMSDSRGRIFLNRPLLPSSGASQTSDKDPYLNSYLERFSIREERYRRWASLEWLLPEGFEWHSHWQWGKRDLGGAIVTLTPWFLERPERRLWLAVFENFYVEVRADLLGPKETSELLSYCHSSARRILSVRSSLHADWLKEFLFTWDVVDFDQELLPSSSDLSLSSEETVDTADEPWRKSAGAWNASDYVNENKPTSETVKEWSARVWQSFSGIKVLSSHSHVPPISRNTVDESVILKWSPLLKSWSDIKQALLWLHSLLQQGRRAFLAPRFAEGLREHEKTFWLREYLLTQQQGHFIRFDERGSYSGQLPWNFYQHLILSRGLRVDRLGFCSDRQNRFMAVLGYPVFHSHSPAFHESYSLLQNAMFLQIPLDQGDLELATSEEESPARFMIDMLPVTQAAITSPLKKCWLLSRGDAGRTFPVNTLKVLPRGSVFADNKNDFLFYNTDLVALLWVWKMWQEKGLDYWQKEDLGRWRQDWEQGLQAMAAHQLEVPAVPWSEVSNINAYSLYRDFVQNFLLLFSLPQPDAFFYVYGQGAMGEILRVVFPEVISVGAREGHKGDLVYFRGSSNLREQGAGGKGLIWAASPDASYHLWLEQELAWIWDMNYHEWSLARSLALQKNIPYLSGRALFVIQAWWQQRLWGIDEK